MCLIFASCLVLLLPTYPRCSSPSSLTNFQRRCVCEGCFIHCVGTKRIEPRTPLPFFDDIRLAAFTAIYFGFIGYATTNTWLIWIAGNRRWVNYFRRVSCMRGYERLFRNFTSYFSNDRECFFFLLCHGSIFRRSSTAPFSPLSQPHDYPNTEADRFANSVLVMSRSCGRSRQQNCA